MLVFSPLPRSVVEDARPAVNTKAQSRRGRDTVVHNPVITAVLLWLAFIKLRRGGFSLKVGKTSGKTKTPPSARVPR